LIFATKIKLFNFENNDVSLPFELVFFLENFQPKIKEVEVKNNYYFFDMKKKKTFFQFNFN
jgi:hypothetical protein